MATRTAMKIAATCGGGAAVLALAFGSVELDGVVAPRTIADPPTTVAPTPGSPDDQCCDPDQPQASAAWECKIGLNCGPIRPRRTWPPSAPPPPSPPPPS
ncbi:hypothetical protein [Mycobacterium sp. E796]|uniref:hypothetical protein n=1 Tax=Mycobacterium sp. E796 TaxID=1834151 RepID=UPI0012EAC245|nr:hypothetical protein [Mycobacterium sp. E796]